MAKHLQFFLCILLLLSAQSANVNVLFLSKEARTLSFTCDYFFLCQVIGDTLQWEVNNQSLGGFTRGETRIVFARTRGTLTYSAVILENQESNGQNMITSVLTISISCADLLLVTCFNDRGNSSTSTATSLPLQNLNEIAVDSSNTILLQHSFSKVILQSTNASKTHCFLCRVESDSQTWTLNNRLPYGFSEFNDMGDALPSQSSGEPIVEEVAFLHAKNPIYTIVLVTEPLPINVSCMSNQHEANLFISDDTTPTILQTPTTNSYTSPFKYNNESSTSEDTALVGGTRDVVLDNNNVPLLAISVGVAACVTVALVLCLMAAIPLIVICKNRRNRKEVVQAANISAIKTLKLS